MLEVNQEHFYHVGAKESNRNSMLEALLMNYNPQNVPAMKKMRSHISRCLFWMKWQMLSNIRGGMKWD